MTTTPDTPVEPDPRVLRSRGRLLDAAAALLTSGGIDAVTIEAVTRASKVARTTLYRQFGGLMQLRAATLERFLVPQAEIPESVGTLRDRLVELVSRQATLIDDAPLHIATLTWMATANPAAPEGGTEATALRRRLVEHYRRPFDELFAGAEARAILGDCEVDQAVAQLIGPAIFLRLASLGRTTRADCARVVDDFLAARAVRHATHPGDLPPTT
ncbi:TetR/AcrR family transcriptional regulator [Nocardia macrotermitis]|uniref:HTH tetR-type domain-containing protein n=1 Tax=Nocardia macrotermitis TaxID=2585198 RepID=A0A7K0DEI8_9NOCA|nr:TetR/AcrR family transcriptional regulator [Nocardia macrotermitis]MQY24213.1 hypothetical protein [Nocardia macrotermitis]